ncbi:helix-turn-helix domain-containing protein [Pararobbsia silviterrae]|uniref:XRE family transcriptional regulator n=1 Tax=Pararobbsia silviterrae TaxID=1792498 RepID=A0A494YAJ4_9BURK|nr:helix-turn-helix transcriptional regulator [Pararobbsia silviterrae]RKP57655.1 XRE family transcriptional regulator [Pararobbsia silviterrae]
MTEIQFIERDGTVEFAVVPIELWNRVASLVEHLDDTALFDRAKAEDDGTRIPAAVLNAELDGAHPIRAWREYRKLTQDALSDASGISKAYLSQIEGGKRTGTAKIYTAIAKALDVSVDVLLPS